MEKQPDRVRKEAAPAAEEQQQQSQEARDLPGPSREGRDPAAGDQESGAELEALPAAAAESPELEKAGTGGLERGISPDASQEEQEQPPRKKSASPERSLEQAEGASTSNQQEGGQKPLPDEPSPEGQEEPPRKKSASLERSQEQAEGASTSSQQEEGEEEEGQQTLPDGSKKRAFTLESRLQDAVKKRLQLRRQLSTPESSSSPASESQEGSDDGSSRDLPLHEESSGDTRDVRGRLKQLKLAVPKPQTPQEPPQTSAQPSPPTSPAQPQPPTSQPPSAPTSPAQPQLPTSPAPPTSQPASPTVSDAMREMFSPGTSDEIWSASAPCSREGSMPGSRPSSSAASSPSRAEGRSLQDVPPEREVPQEATEGRSVLEEEAEKEAGLFPGPDLEGLFTCSATGVFRSSVGETSAFRGIPEEPLEEQQKASEDPVCEEPGEGTGLGQGQEGPPAWTLGPLAAVAASAFGGLQQKPQPQQQQQQQQKAGGEGAQLGEQQTGQGGAALAEDSGEQEPGPEGEAEEGRPLGQDSPGPEPRRASKRKSTAGHCGLVPKRGRK
ncbi:serine/arginine repetitive matrix protein 1-like [Schistocerca gregaria]|uniref:serine/arginine repetitive matrix protein 1-like n=1 Tax=Schistocerca gregaria TaxID=7010 RepID=UPI00211DE91D|nr:serine/arginine repetitive matrix protein 1-like [Schistocerca gregaria]XP_049854409.1 serine/arginine repetitive matrix protein 1-like [Schistocerca gregaria]